MTTPSSNTPVTPRPANEAPAPTVQLYRVVASHYTPGTPYKRLTLEAIKKPTGVA